MIITGYGRIRRVDRNNKPRVEWNKLTVPDETRPAAWQLARERWFEQRVYQPQFVSCGMIRGAKP